MICHGILNPEVGSPICHTLASLKSVFSLRLFITIKYTTNPAHIPPINCEDILTNDFHTPSLPTNIDDIVIIGLAWTDHNPNIDAPDFVPITEPGAITIKTNKNVEIISVST